MIKKAKITCCEECPHMDYSYYDYKGECCLLKKIIKDDIKLYEEIHPECPLEDWND